MRAIRGLVAGGILALASSPLAAGSGQGGFLGESGGSGHGGVLGLGMDFGSSGPWYLTPSVEYAWGESHGTLSPPGVYQDQEHRALSLRLGFTYR